MRSERPQPGNCPATSQGRKGSEKRRSVLLLGLRGAKHPIVYGFSSDQRRWGARMGKSRGLRGRQWLRLGGHRALSSGQRDLASDRTAERSGKTLSCSASNTFSIPSSAGGGWRETDGLGQTLFLSSFGDKEVGGSLWKSHGPGGYLAQSHCSGHRTIWPPGPPLHCSTRGGHTVSASSSLPSSQTGDQGLQVLAKM